MSDSALSTDHASRVRRIFQAAWLAILLGIGLQLLVFLVRLVAGFQTPMAAMLADLTQNVTWSFIVCVGVAIGVTAERARVFLGGLLGAISGPVGWSLAKAAQRAVQALLGSPVDQLTQFFLLLVAVKGFEYLLLGLAVGESSDKPKTSLRDYARPGVLVGLVFSAVVVGLNLWHAQAVGQPMATAKLIGLAVGEFLFPVSCALVIYASVHLRRYGGLTGETVG